MIREKLLEAFAALPDGVNGEIVGEEMVVSPRPWILNASACGALLNAIGWAFGRGEGNEWIILFEPELRFDDAIVVPNLAAWRRTRLPELPDAAYLTLVPDWVCEVLAPSSARFDRTAKMPLYAREGVGHAWLVDPHRKSLEVFERDVDGWSPVLMATGAEVVRARPFETYSLDLSELWAR